MSVRSSRPVSGRSGVKKAAGGGKRKVSGRQAWDSSVHDLGVHRATPEELAHRHEIHKSKNHSLAQWELKKRALRKEWRRQNGGTPDPLEDRRLGLMMEILSDQYQMKDVLERSDRAMAVVKDLFGDAPRRHTGFPYVTMAPSCDLDTSRGPIAQKKDPPTRLSVLSEGIMDSQALNDVEESGPQDSDDDDDDDDAEVSISFQPGLHTHRIRRILNEETSRLTSEDWSRDKNPPVTPKGDPSNDQTALNATAAVNKVKTRLTLEEQEEPEDSSVIGRVLNPHPINPRKLQSKGKKKKPSHVSSSQSTAPPAVSTHEASGCSQSGLDVLNHMIQEVERELEAYERESGREVSSVPQCHGLTGFTLSLVSSIRRLVSYLKESDRQLRQEALERQRLKEELGEQRLLIDALTAEILAIKDGGSLSPGSHHFVSDQSQSSPGEALTNIRMPDPEEAKPTAPVPDLRTKQGGEVSAAPHAGSNVSTQMTTSLRDTASLLDFQPAIMLSPPTQKSRSDIRSQTSSFLSHEIVSLSSEDSAGAPGSDPAAHRWQLASCARALPCVGPVLESDGCGGAVRVEDDIVARMAELTCQNNALKAQLSQLRTGSGGDITGTSQVATKTKQEAMSAPPPASLEMRIAELNRQSAEARDKLLRLIEQQKNSLVVSPAISPITPQQGEPGRRARSMDAVTPLPQLTDSSMEETPSPGSRGSGRRSSASQRSNTSVTGSTRGGRAMAEPQWGKGCKDSEEGWFALSTHVS